MRHGSDGSNKKVARKADWEQSQSRAGIREEGANRPTLSLATASALNPSFYCTDADAYPTINTRDTVGNLMDLEVTLEPTLEEKPEYVFVDISVIF